MEWLSQNWIWFVFAIGIFLLMRRGGTGCGMAHGGHASHASDEADQADNSDRHWKDPVSGERIINRKNAINSMYQGHVY